MLAEDDDIALSQPGRIRCVERTIDDVLLRGGNFDTLRQARLHGHGDLGSPVGQWYSCRAIARTWLGACGRGVGEHPEGHQDGCMLAACPGCSRHGCAARQGPQASSSSLLLELACDGEGGGGAGGGMKRACSAVTLASIPETLVWRSMSQNPRSSCLAACDATSSRTMASRSRPTSAALLGARAA